jgi:hypothetical protein
MSITIEQIKEQTKRGSPYFFSRDTLKWWGQRLKDFRVVISPGGRIFLYAPSRQWVRGERVLMGYTVREYVQDKEDSLNSRLVSIDGLEVHNLDSIKRYIQEH